jgi:hypothetical protein
MQTYPTYLSFVEVVGGSGTFKPFLVIPNEEVVSTRYLFVFPQGSQSSVSAEALAKEMKVKAFDVNALKPAHH